MWGTANGAVEPFTFFLESQETVYTSKYTVERATIALVLNTTYLTVKEAVVNTKTMYTKWHSFASFSNTDFSAEYKDILDVGKGDFEKINSKLEHLYSYLDSTSIEAPSTTCVLYVPLFSSAELTDFNFLKKKLSVISAQWTYPEIDGEKKLLLDTFSAHYNSLADRWLTLVNMGTKFLEQIHMKTFPVELTADLENLECIPNTQYEKVVILEAKAGTEAYFAEIEVYLPTESKSVVKLLLVPYKGYTLQVPEEGTHFVKQAGGPKLFKYKCENSEVLNDKAPLCTIEEIDNLCTQAILRNEIDVALWKCHFSRDTSDLYATRLLDEGILVTSNKYAVAEGTKMLYQNPPIVIYTNLLITLTDEKGEEIKFPATIQVRDQKVVQSALTEVQKQLIATRGAINDFWSTIDWTEYANYGSWVLQLLITPLTFLGLIFSCKHKRLIAKAKKTVSVKKARKGRAVNNDMLLQQLEM
jgi:hypothetical protein